MNTLARSCSSLGALIIAASASTISVAQGAETFTFSGADLTSYTYPFVGQRSNVEEPVFGAYNFTSFVGAFDHRDGQLQIAYDTADAGVPTSLGPQNYIVRRAEITWTLGSLVGAPGYDPTLDAFETYPVVGGSAPTPDADAGRPLTLFGADFRPPYVGFSFDPDNDPNFNVAQIDAFDPEDPSTFQFYAESGEAYGPPGGGAQSRFVYPVDFNANGELRDVSYNLDEADIGTPDYDPFDPNPFAIGTTTEIVPGQPLVSGTDITFDVKVEDDFIQGYVAEGLDSGALGFVLATLHPAADFTQGGIGGDYPRFFLESPGGQKAAALELDVLVCQDGCGDTDGDFDVDADDFITVLVEFGRVGPGLAADFDGDHAVDATDFIIVLVTFGSECCPLLPM
ncbi:MAG: hypothetical protein AAGI30_03015 [Planctomycetota bacterium]